MQFNAVYHVAALNHWREVVEEQLPLLLRNHGIKNLHVTIAAPSKEVADSCGEIIARGIQNSGRAVPLNILNRWLDEFEHPAMELIDDIARHDNLPILYFHAKAVSYSPPNVLFEKWRRYLNQFISEADRWAEVLAQRDYDACGPLKVFDRNNGYTYFAGNFWMAKADYVRRLPPYADFVRNPDLRYSRPLNRYLAEIAINRSKSLRALAADNTDLTHESIWPYLHQVAI